MGRCWPTKSAKSRAQRPEIQLKIGNQKQQTNKMTMKTKLLIIATWLASLVATAQTNTNTGVNLPITIPGFIGFFTNLPDTTPDLANIGLSAGIVTLRSAPENYVKVDYDVGAGTNFLSRLVFSGEIYNAPEASGIDALAVYGGMRPMVGSNYEVTLQGFGRRNFSTVNDGLITPGYSGGGQVEASWRMLTGNNIFWNAAVDCESPTQKHGPWSQSLKGGIKFYF